MSKAENEVDALVQAYLAQQAEPIDGVAGLARVKSAMAPKGSRRWLRSSRLLLGGAVAAAVVLAFFGGWHLNPVQASPRELLEEAKRVHNQPLSRCYLVEIHRMVEDEEDRAPLGKAARQVRVWTRGDRFWVEMQHTDAGPPFIWGRGEDGSLWAVLDAQRGVRAPMDQVPRPLHRIADFCTLNVDTLLGDVLQDCTLTDETADASKLTRVILAEPTSQRTRRWLEKATLEIDNEAKVLRRLTILRNVLGRPQAQVTFSLLETRPEDNAEYQLEGHLAEPARIIEGDIAPRVKLELLARWFGVRKEGRSAKNAAPIPFKDGDGRTHTPLSPVDKKATVFLFLLPDCPISNAYAPEIKRIAADYEAKKIAVFVVHADPDVTAEQARKHAKAFGLTCPVLLDPTHVLVKASGATMAPEAAVIGPDRSVLYRGRIDDWYADYGKRRGEPTQRDLRNALDAILQGKTVATPLTKVIGCYLPEPKL